MVCREVGMNTKGHMSRQDTFCMSAVELLYLLSIWLWMLCILITLDVPSGVYYNRAVFQDN